MTARRMVVAIGSNLGDRLTTVRRAMRAIAGLPGVEPIAASSVYETPALTPTGVDETAPRYLNAVVTFRSARAPEEVLTDLQGLERRFGRLRTGRWASRTLDLDLVDVDGLELHGERLQLPHPRAWERAFVLVPWHEIEPDASIPGRGPIGELLAAASDRVELFAAAEPAGGAPGTDRGLPLVGPGSALPGRPPAEDVP